MNAEKRNKLFEEKKHFVDMTVNKHYIIVRTCHLEWEDVMQELYLKLLRLIDRYNPRICKNMDAYLLLNLKYGLWNLVSGSKLTGMPGAPKRGFRLVSLDSMMNYPESKYADGNLPGGSLLEEAIDSLPCKEKSILNAYIDGRRRIHVTNRTLQSARRYLISKVPNICRISA